jgi:serine/threonine protein kinase
MPQEARQKVGDVLGGWELKELLGIGGNAEVWRASKPGVPDVALKRLREVRQESERYRRFRDEIQFLREHGGHPGVLPLHEVNLPEKPDRRDPPWFTMPVARRLDESLSPSRRLRDVVAAMATIATTLADLHERGISHRDIKPSNLYFFNDSYRIGDFGLVAYPGKEDHTTNERGMGPIHFFAPEMLIGPADADGALADVWSFAKSLFVLATGRRYPPPGEQRVANRLHTIAGNVREPDAGTLDALIERCTQLEPALRPSMKDVALSLSEWLTLPPINLDVEKFTPVIHRLNVAARAEPTRHAVHSGDCRGGATAPCGRSSSHGPTPHQHWRTLRGLGIAIAGSKI